MWRGFVKLLLLAVFCPALGWSAPTITRITPSSGIQGATLDLTITGSGFAAAGTVVILSGDGVVLNGVRVVNSTSLIATVTLSGDPGVRSVSISSGGVSNDAAFEIL